MPFRCERRFCPLSDTAIGTFQQGRVGGVAIMTATALDSAIFRDIFSAPEMRRVFSDEARTEYYLKIEAALARAQARLGIIPEKAAREIEDQCRIEKIDLSRLKM